MFLISKMLLLGQQGLLFSFPLMEKKQKIKLIRCRAFPITEVFLQRISETTPLFEGLNDEVVAACHATTPEALCSILHSLNQIEPGYRIEQGAGTNFQYQVLAKKLHEIMLSDVKAVCPERYRDCYFLSRKEVKRETKEHGDPSPSQGLSGALRNKEQYKLRMFLTSKMLPSGQQGLLFSFPLMEKKHPESIRDKLIR